MSEPGNKMSGYAHEDTVWITCHVTKLRDIPAIERELCIAPEELPGYYDAQAQLQGESA